MTFEQMQALIGQMLEVQRQLQENQLIHTAEMAEIRAVANSNARAIEALGERQDAYYAKTQTQLLELIRVVGYIGDRTDQRFEQVQDRLNRLEN
ncbi:MAG: hypothetical protein SFT94_06855 [Pseudanabaenaceae cyanobacterium bins.68]|nr:hypothetical protein [Pseudanabaenaceae cyanobacterium bins.68]